MNERHGAVGATTGRRRKWTTTTAAACGCLLALAVGACGSGGDDTTGTQSGSANTGTSQAGASGSPIVIAQIAAQDNPVSDLSGMVDVADAAAKWINANGGVNGHPIVVKHCNDQLDPNQAQVCARQAISDKAVAVVGSFTNFGTNVLPVLEQAKTPYVAGYLGSPADYTSPIVFAVGNAGSVGTSAAIAEGIKSLDPTKVNQVSIDLAAGQASVDVINKNLQALGVPVGKNVKVPPTATDYSSYVSQAVEGADVIAPTLAPPQFVPFAKALQQTGSDATVAAAAGLVNNQVIAQAGGASGPLEGMVVGSSFPALSDPAWADFKSAMEKYAPQSKAVVEQNQEQSTWVSMMAFAQVAGTVDGDITADKLLDAFNNASGVEVQGLTPALDFTKPFQVPSLARLANRWVFPLTVKDGEIAGSGDGKPIDITDLLVKANGS